REPLEKTLLEIREMMNAAENPFNLLAQSVRMAENQPDSKGQKTQTAKGEPSGTRSEIPKNDVIASKAEEFHGFGWEGPENLSYFIQVVAAVDLMTLVVGKDYLLRLVNMLAWKNLISKELVETIKEALEFLSSVETAHGLKGVANTQPSITDVLVVLYIIYHLSKRDEGPLTFLLLSSSSSLNLLSKNWGGRQ
ncbi:MAG: hypothetical protein RMK31_08875, partial [Candidatus Caldarchaeum sp.]|nr:hypothetical protein [Candidatus Caldarchaeum sp.]